MFGARRSCTGRHTIETKTHHSTGIIAIDTINTWSGRDPFCAMSSFPKCQLARVRHESNVGKRGPEQLNVLTGRRWRTMCHCIENMSAAASSCSRNDSEYSLSLLLLDIGKHLNHCEQGPGGCRIGGSKDWRTSYPGAKCLRSTQKRQCAGAAVFRHSQMQRPECAFSNPLNASRFSRVLKLASLPSCLCFQYPPQKASRRRPASRSLPFSFALITSLLLSSPAIRAPSRGGRRHSILPKGPHDSCADPLSLV